MDYFGKRDLIYIDLLSSKDVMKQMSRSPDAEWRAKSRDNLGLEIFKLTYNILYIK